MLIRMILRKHQHIWPVFNNIVREEVKRSLYFMLKVVVADAMEDSLVTAVAVEEAATAEEAKVDLEVVVEGEQNLIFPPDNTLTRNWRFLATIIRARYLLSAMNLNLARSMRSVYQNLQSLILPRLQPDRTLVWNPQERNIVPATTCLH